MTPCFTETGFTAVIDVWGWSLDRPAQEIPKFWQVLAEDERQRAMRYVKARDTARYIVGRGELRHILGLYLGAAPQELVFSYNDFGKPQLCSPNHEGLEFNLSHSAGTAMLAVSDRFAIGIDIEEEQPLKENIAEHFFSRKECAALKSVPAHLYTATFYRCWTRKEAFVKAHGEGLSLPLDSFDVPLGLEPELRLERFDAADGRPEDWSLLSLDVPMGFLGAVAAFTKGASVRLRYQTIPGLGATRASMT